MENKELSKSQKKKLRKQRCKQLKPAVHKPHYFEYKYNASRSKRYFLHRTSTYEKIPAKHFLMDSGFSEDEIFDRLVSEICREDVGVNSDKVRQVLSRNGLFEEKCRKFIHKFRRINLKVLIEHHCPKAGSSLPTELGNLLRFLKSVFHKTGMFQLLPDNPNSIEKCLKRFLTKTKSSPVLLGELMQDFLPSQLSWLKLSPPNLQSNILAKLVSWTFFSFTHLLVTSFFHPTDSTHRKHQIIFYRKSVWQSITSKALAKLTPDRLHRLSPKQKLQVLSSCSAPSTACLRFIPKLDKTKVRPVATRGQKVDSSLISLTKSYAGEFPAKSDLSGQILHRPWGQVVTQLGKEDPLYWVVADIDDAFGSIELAKLVSILKILADKTSIADKSMTMSLCKRLVLQTASYKVGGVTMTYHVRQGVLQGDPLSSNLSDIYYGHMIVTCLQDFVTPPAGVVEMFLRGADDFLFLSSHLGRAQQFLSLIKSGFPSHHCFFHPGKTRTNLDTLQQDLSIPFCGSLLHTSTREISPSYAGYSNSNVYYSQMGPKAGIRPGSFISSKFLFFCKIRQTSLYYGQYNSKARQLATLAGNVSLALRRLTAMLDMLVWSRGRAVQEKWLWQILMGGFRRFKGSCRRTSINLAEVEWIALYCLRQAVIILIKVEFLILLVLSKLLIHCHDQICFKN